MKISLATTGPKEAEAEAVVVGIASAGQLRGAAAVVDEATGGLLQRMREAEEINGKVGETITIHGPQGLRTPVLLVVGLGPAEALDRGRAFQAAAAAAKQLALKPRARVAYYLGADWPADWNASGVSGVIVGCQGQDLYRSKKQLHPFETVTWEGGDDDSIRRGQVMGQSVNLTRHLVNEPPSTMSPEAFADRVREVAAECGMECEIWNRSRLHRERCGALLAVARGSAAEPRLAMVRYLGGGEGRPLLGLVGKGVTFDSGGLSIKPSDGMKTMKCDMAGAATVLGAIQAIACLHLPVNVIGLMGMVENMVSGDAYKLGDVLEARSGKTIEVLNTDAEGRLVLADVLNVAISQGATHLVDIATLTGACVVALGTDVAGVMTNNQSWCDQLTAAASSCGEPVWQLPMFREYAEQIRSPVADIKNVGEGRWGGAITAAKFLEEFVEDKPWTHVDIAGPSFLEKPKPWLDAGGSGFLVRSLVELASRFGQQDL